MKLNPSLSKPISPQVQKEELSEKAQLELKKLKDTSQQVEAIFIKDLLSKMRQISLTGEHPTGMSELAWDLFDQTVSKTLSEKDSFGLSKIIYEKHSLQIIQQDKAEQSLEGGLGD